MKASASFRKRSTSRCTARPAKNATAADVLRLAFAKLGVDIALLAGAQASEMATRCGQPRSMPDGVNSLLRLLMEKSFSIEDFVPIVFRESQARQTATLKLTEISADTGARELRCKKSTTY